MVFRIHQGAFGSILHKAGRKGENDRFAVGRGAQVLAARPPRGMIKLP